MSAIAASDGLNLDEIFNFDDADMTLRSSDGVHFGVHRCILRRISPFFADMLSLPQPSQIGDTRASIDMAEDAACLRLFLGTCYPRAFCPEPKLEDVVDIERAAAVAHKFDSPAMHLALEGALSRYAQHKPEVAYVIAWRYELKNALRAAARATLDRTPLLDKSWDVSVFESIPATSLVQLYRYHTAVAEVLAPLRDMAVPIEWIANRDITLSISGCSNDGQLNLLFHETDINGDETSTIITRSTFRWWWLFVVDVITGVQSPSHPPVHVVLDQAFRKMMSGGKACATCRSGPRWHMVMQTTRDKLHQEIERRLSEIPLQTPF